MLVGDVDISVFKARLMSRIINNAELNIYNYFGNVNINPIFFINGSNKFKELTLKLDILCKDFNELEIMKSNLIRHLEISTIKFDDIDFYYRGFLSTNPTYSYVMKGNEIAEIKMLVIAYKDEVTEIMNRITNKTINVAGNLKTPAIVEITPSTELIDLTLTGLDDSPIILKNLKANKKIIIDGENCTVTVDGVNKFSDTDMWGFPKLKPGANTITVNKSSVDITIKYKPRYI